MQGAIRGSSAVCRRLSTEEVKVEVVVKGEGWE